MIQTAEDIELVVCDRSTHHVTAVFTELQQVVLNCVVNAEQAIVMSGRLPGRITIRAEDAGDRVVIEVEDTGPGIPDDLIPVVFDKFRQLDSSTTRNHSGAGLGLYIVKTFTELLGGAISVQSKLGEGSVFIVRLSAGPVGEKARPGVPLTVEQEL